MGEEKDYEKSSGMLRWHPAFLQAVQQELFDYRDFLEFRYEYQLASEPLRIDLLIIKKPKDIIIEKNIARIFRTDNILEYKSPDDYLSVKDFLKVYAYANLYAAINPGVELSDITITFVEGRYPRNLLKYLVDIRGYKAEEVSRGIYLITGDYIPIQIVESKKLSESENIWLKSLTNDLEIRSLEAILERRKQGVFPDAYFDVLIRANPEVFLEVLKMANGTMTFEEVFTKAGIIPQWIERGREEGREEKMKEIARNALAEGASFEFVNKITGLCMETIKILAKQDYSK